MSGHFHLFVLFATMYRVVTMDECTKSMDAALDAHLVGNGFHQILTTALNFSSANRLVDCVLVYAFHIPGDCFIDIETFNRQFTKRLHTHCLTAGRFDVESPSADGPSRKRFSTVYFHTTRIARKTFTLSDTLEFPIHFRYRRPIPSSANLESFAFVVIPQPEVFLRCDQQNGLLEVACKKRLGKVPCACPESAMNGRKAFCGAVRLELSSASKKGMKTEIPVGNLENVQCIVLMTFLTTCSLLFLILYNVAYCKLDE